jgi:hypothetical protein
MPSNNIKAIETSYRGYRFRSRTEARWAVFFDAAGIDWQYELDGFCINGKSYLPDFWLPQHELFVEIKPHKEACVQALPLIKEFVASGDHPSLLVAGPPNADMPPHLFYVYRFSRSRPDDPEAMMRPVSFGQCPFCDRIDVDVGGWRCNCVAGLSVLRWKNCAQTPRLEYALSQGQQARFEHGEDARPDPYLKPVNPNVLRVYVAGAVLEEGAGESYEDENGQIEHFPSLELLSWRQELAKLFGGALEVGDRCGRFEYAGPTILTFHGQFEDALATQCLEEARDADIMFAWIDRDSIGTMVEIGAMRALGKPMFLAFSSKALSEEFYFIEQLATVSLIAPDADTAWRCFVRWADRQEVSRESGSHSGRRA